MGHSRLRRFGEIRVEEYSGLDAIARWAEGIDKHGPAFAAWVALGNDGAEAISEFEDRYQGEWVSIEPYATNMLDELGVESVLDDVPAWLQPYVEVDEEGFARDLELGGDIITAETPEGGVWVWSGM